MALCRGEVHMVLSDVVGTVETFCCCFCRLNKLHDFVISGRKGARMHLERHQEAGHTSLGAGLHEAIESLRETEG